MNTQESRAFERIFFPNGIPFTEHNYTDTMIPGKYSDKLKSDFLNRILKKSDFNNADTVNLFIRCIPEGFNDQASISDQAYEALLKEFPDITGDQIK